MTSDPNDRHGSGQGSASTTSSPTSSGAATSSTASVGGASGAAERAEADKAHAREAIGREADSARSEAKAAGQTVKDEASRFASQAKERAFKGAEGGKEYAAGNLDDFAAAIRKASDELGERDQSMAASMVREVASGLEQASRSIKGRSVQDMTRSVASFARRQPTAFLVGAALAGVALGRFARASGEHDDHDHAGYGSRDSDVYGRSYADRSRRTEGAYPGRSPTTGGVAGAGSTTSGAAGSGLGRSETGGSGGAFSSGSNASVAGSRSTMGTTDTPSGHGTGTAGSSTAPGTTYKPTTGGSDGR